MYEEEYAAHEASLADMGYVYASGNRLFDLTASMLNKELDGFPTARQRVKYLEELIRQVEEEHEEFNSKLSALESTIKCCNSFPEHETWKIQHKKWEDEKLENAFDGEPDTPLSAPSIDFQTLTENHAFFAAYGKETAEELKAKCRTIANIYFSDFDDWKNTSQFDGIKNHIKGQIKLFQNALKHWKIYAAVESEAPMQLQPSTPEQASVQKITLAEGITAADIERIFTAMQQAGIITTNVTGERIAQMFFAEKPQSLTNNYDKAKSVRNGEAQGSKNSERLRGFAQIILRDLKPK